MLQLTVPVGKAPHCLSSGSTLTLFQTATKHIPYGIIKVIHIWGSGERTSMMLLKPVTSIQAPGPLLRSLFQELAF